MTTVSAQPPPPVTAGRRGLGARIGPVLGTVPFFGYVTVFLLVPTVIVVVGAFSKRGGGFTFSNIKALNDPNVLHALWQSVVLSVVTAVIGAVVGGLLAYVLTTASPTGVLRKVLTAACSVLAQFGGVMLAFAFVATFSARGMVSRIFDDLLGVQVTPDWLSSLNGLILVYAYFQIPLMVIVFLPAVDGMRVQWREATESLGGSTWAFWRHVGGPLLMPAFIGSMLLLFANSFSAYATAAALISQYNPLIALQVQGAMTSETGASAANLAQALALLMVVVVALVMILYALLQRRTSRWLR